jgi:phasin family protein
MSNEYFANLQSVAAPVVQGNKLAVANLEKLVAFQLSAVQSYVDLGIARMKAATEVNGPQDAQAFVNGQVESANAFRTKLMEDAKALADLFAGFKGEFEKFAKENMSELTPKAIKATAPKAPASKAPAAAKAGASKAA